MGKGSAPRPIPDRKRFESNWEKTFGKKAEREKPVVRFTGTVVFDSETYPDCEVARVTTVDHYVWGSDKVRTSKVLKKFDDGSFETMNTIYKPYTDMEGS